MTCNFFRRPKTFAEMKANLMVEEDDDLQYFNIKIRAKRRAKNLPNEWEDKQRSFERCWKKQRHTQYKI